MLLSHRQRIAVLYDVIYTALNAVVIINLSRWRAARRKQSRSFNCIKRAKSFKLSVAKRTQFDTT